MDTQNSKGRNKQTWWSSRKIITDVDLTIRRSDSNAYSDSFVIAAALVFLTSYKLFPDLNIEMIHRHCLITSILKLSLCTLKIFFTLNTIKFSISMENISALSLLLFHLNNSHCFYLFFDTAV